MKKYKVVGGYVESQNDGDSHYVSALQLCLLYGVNPSECHLVNLHKQATFRRLYSGNDLIELHPRRDGHYFLPKENKEKL